MKRTYKTVQKISGNVKMYRKWSEWAVGDIVIGKYVDTQEDKFSKKMCPVIEVEDVYFKDVTFAERLQGKQLVVNHTGMIGKAFEKVNIGQTVQIEYGGMSLIERGPMAGKESHLASVSIVEEETSTIDEDYADL